jgi:CRP-like cAMP-binding protein
MTTGEDRAMHYLREVSRLYEKETGVKLMPRVGNLGTRTEEGATGMSVLVKQVSKWIERREE